MGILLTGDLTLTSSPCCGLSPWPKPLRIARATAWTLVFTFSLRSGLSRRLRLPDAVAHIKLAHASPEKGLFVNCFYPDSTHSLSLAQAVFPFVASVYVKLG